MRKFPVCMYIWPPNFNSKATIVCALFMARACTIVACLCYFMCLCLTYLAIWCVTVRATVGNFIVECGVFLFSLFLFSDFKRLHLIYYNQVLPNLLPLPLPIVCAFAFAFAFAYWFLPLVLFVSPLCCPHQQSQPAYPSSGLVDTFKSKTTQVLTNWFRLLLCVLCWF